MISTTTQKEELLRRAEQYHRSIRCDMRTNEYVETVQVPCETRGYKKEIEPIVPHDPYCIAPAWLTMNSYNALILNVAVHCLNRRCVGFRGVVRLRDGYGKNETGCRRGEDRC